MDSIFNLITDSSELSSSNQGMSRMAYDQHAPTRDVSGNNFPNGAINIRWQVSGTKYWVPSRSYCRIRGSLGKADGTQLSVSDGIAPNMGLASNLFQSLEFRLNDKTISRVSDFVPQVDALETRLSKSRGWLNGIGASINFWDEDFKNRLSDVASDGVNDQEELITERLGLGYDAGTNTVAVAADNGILTFAVAAGAALPTLADVWQIGDEIEIDGAGVIGTVRYQVSALTGAQTIQLNNLQTIALPAAGVSFRRIRKTNVARKVINFEIIWQPPLSVFKLTHAMPSGKYEIVLNPQTSTVYQKYAVESLLGGGDKVANISSSGVATANSTYKFNIVDMYMMVNTVLGPRIDNLSYLLDLESTRCQSDSITTKAFQQKNFTVSPSTYALSVAFQDSRAGTNTQISASKFISYNAALTENESEKLTRFYVGFGGQNFPSPDADPEFSSTVDYTTQRYVESQMYSGSFYDSSGGESLAEWQDRGRYYHFSTPRDGSDRSSQVGVHQSFSSVADPNSMRVMLFDHSKEVVRVSIQDGQVIQVDLQNV